MLQSHANQSASELQARLRALLDSFPGRGITPRVDDAGKLHCTPRKSLTDQEVRLIKAHRDHLIAMIVADSAPPSTDNTDTSHNRATLDSHPTADHKPAGSSDTQDANHDVIAGTRIRLGVVATQLAALSPGVQAIRAEIHVAVSGICNANDITDITRGPDGPFDALLRASEQAAALTDALNLPRELLDAVRAELTLK